MTVVHTFKAEKSHERFRLTASTVETGAGQWVHVVVEDTEARSAIKLYRSEMLPLFRAMAEVMKTVEDAASGLPSDPVKRAARRFPHGARFHGYPVVPILRDYGRELDELRERYIQRFDELTERFYNQPPYTPPQPQVPKGQWDLGS